MKFKQLFEASQRGKLYHFTSYIKCYNICLDDIMLTGEIDWADKMSKEKYNKVNPNRISFTRNKNFDLHPRSNIDVDVRIEIDGNKLSENKKIIPFSYYGTYSLDSKSGESLRKVIYSNEKNILMYDESEEYVPTGSIRNIHNYILSIKINDYYKAFERIPKYIQFITDYCKKYNIKLELGV